MTTEAQVVANRLNAQKSTGPRTAEGKAVVAQNAVKHGLRAEQAVIKGQDPGEFEFYRDEMLGELAPAGAMESMLAERVVGLAWRLRRAERLQNEAIDALLARDASPISKLLRSMDAKRKNGGPDDAETALGRVVAKDFTCARILAQLALYVANPAVERKLRRINRLALAGKDPVIRMEFAGLEITSHAIEQGGQAMQVPSQDIAPFYLVREVQLVQQGMAF